MRTELPCISVFTSKAEDFREAADLGQLAGARRPRPSWAPRVSQTARACAPAGPGDLPSLESANVSGTHASSRPSPSVSPQRPEVQGGDAELLARAGTRL